jgi:hypothetical protein
VVFGIMVWWFVTAVLLVWRSPIRHTATWTAATTTSVTLGVAATAGWIWYTRQPDLATRRIVPWQWISAGAWVVAIITAPAIGQQVQPPANAYTIAALWYQVTGFLGMATWVIHGLWFRRERLRDRTRHLP